MELNDILISSFIESINGLQSPNQCADPQQYYLQRVKIIDSLFITRSPLNSFVVTGVSCFVQPFLSPVFLLIGA